MSELHKRMRVARKHLGLSQTKMAESAGMSLRGYQSNERGESTPSAIILKVLADYGISPLWILRGKGEMLLGDTQQNKPSEPNPLEAQVKANTKNIDTLWECARSTNIQVECLLKLHERTRQPLIKRVWDWVFGNNIKA